MTMTRKELIEICDKTIEFYREELETDISNQELIDFFRESIVKFEEMKKYFLDNIKK